MSVASASSEELAPVAALLARRTGLVFPESRQDALAAAVARSMARLGASSPGELVLALEAAPLALDELVGELTVSESFFFRVPQQLEFLRREALPELLRRGGPGHRLRLLSAGCASGEEPYSLAILLEEEGLAACSVVIGTDISRAALARAARASFSDWSLRASSGPFRDRYFRREGDRWQLHSRIRDRVELAYLNLAEDSYPSHATGIAAFDVILCRNALIYFSPEAVARVAARLHASLVDGGWLITSPFDPPLGQHAPFEVTMTAGGIVYRRAGGQPLPFALAPIVEAKAPGWMVADDLAPIPAPIGVASFHALAEGRVRGGGRDSRFEPDGPDEAIRRIRAAADGGRLADGLEAAAVASRRFPTSPGVHFLHGVLLAEAGRDRDAAGVLRRTLYLDRTLAVAALLLGLVLRRLGDAAAARRSLRSARTLLAACGDGPVPLGEGDRASRLLVAVDTQLRLLEEIPP